MSKEILLSEEYAQRADVKALCNRIEETFLNGEGELIYDGRNKLRRFVMDDGLVLIAKQYKRPNAFQRLCYSTFWPNKSKKAYRFAHELTRIGIQTPAAVASITLKQGLLVDRYYFLSLEDTGTESQLIARPLCEKGDMQGLRTFLAALVPTIVRMHEHGFMHGDMNLSNFLCHQTPEGLSFSVIDTNRSHLLQRPATYRECMTNLCRTTHIRPMLEVLVDEYCRCRGWDATQAKADVLASLDAFERHKEKQKKLKHKSQLFKK